MGIQDATWRRIEVRFNPDKLGMSKRNVEDAINKVEVDSPNATEGVCEDTFVVLAKRANGKLAAAVQDPHLGETRIYENNSKNGTLFDILLKVTEGINRYLKGKCPTLQVEVQPAA
jgi:hypothetical protein